MANPIQTSTPLDQPHIQRPGVMYRESDRPGAMKHLWLPPESPERAAKGDIGEQRMDPPVPQALSHPGLPYRLKK